MDEGFRARSQIQEPAMDWAKNTSLGMINNITGRSRKPEKKISHVCRISFMLAVRLGGSGSVAGVRQCKWVEISLTDIRSSIAL